MFANLSRVCRFFANFCLPRIYEFVEFSGSVFREDTPTKIAVYETSRETMLCTQIAAKQPLALALAKTVRVCYFAGLYSGLDGTGSWVTRSFTNKCIAGMLHIKNLRELKFTASFVDAGDWDAIATLGSLEELSFDSCDFLSGAVDVELEKRVRVKVSRLQMVDCIGVRQPIAAIDARSLRTLVMDDLTFDHVTWLSQTALTELHVTIRRSFDNSVDLQMQRLYAILIQAHQSLEALALFVEVSFGLAQEVVRNTFDDPAWKNLPLLRSLTLSVCLVCGDAATNVRQPSSSSVSRGS